MLIYVFTDIHVKAEVFRIKLRGIQMKKVLIVGAGYAGAVCAQRFAEAGGYQVHIIDRRPHIGGNMYDSYNKDGILVHWYGPHISVMNNQRTFEFLSKFTEWVPYHHRVNVDIDGVEVPLPINFTSIDLLYPVDQAMSIKKILMENYGEGTNVPILELRKSTDSRIQEFANDIFEKVFFHYTAKMWGLAPEEIDPSVTGRIPVRLSYDNRHFLHKYQVMPKLGFTHLFEKMLNHPNISISLGVNAEHILKLDNVNKRVLVSGETFEGLVIYTGALDELFQFSKGELPYRSLRFQWETSHRNYVQDSTVLNWPDTRPETRRTEMKRLTGQKKEGITTTLVEFPGEYKRGSTVFGEPFYPIDAVPYKEIHRKYLEELKQYPQIIPVGRLADYKYYNMEAVILRALSVMDEILN